MTWPEYVALNRQWKLWPPAVVSLAILAQQTPQQRGIGTPSKPTINDSDQYAQNIEALTGLIGAPPPNGG